MDQRVPTKKARWGLAVFLFLLTAVLCGYGFYRVGELEEKIAKNAQEAAKPSGITRDNAQDVIRGWFKDTALSVRELQESEHPAAFFAFQVTLPSGKGVTIERRKDQPNGIRVSADVGESPQWSAALAALPHDKFIATTTVVEMALARTGLQYQIQLPRYYIAKDLFFGESLNEDGFLNAVGGVTEAITIAQGTIYLQLYASKGTQDR